MLKQFIAQLTTDMGFEQPLAANENGSYSLRLEPDLDIILREDLDATIMLQVLVAQLPTQNIEEFYCKIMAANLLGRETGGAALGLDHQEKHLILIAFLIEGQNYKLFYERIEEMANYAEAWRQETRDFIEQHEAE